MLVYLQHAVVDGRVDQSGNRRVVSKRFEFVKVAPDGWPGQPDGRPTLMCDRQPMMSFAGRPR